MPTDYSGNPAQFHDPIQLPSDGDVRDAASVNTALEAIVDNLAVLHGGWGIIDEAVDVHTEASDDPGTWSSWYSNASNAFTTVLATVAGALGTAEDGDMLIVDVFLVAIQGSGANGIVKVEVGNDTDGWTTITGAKARVGSVASAYCAFTFRHLHTGADKDLDVRVRAKNSTGDTLTASGPGYLRALRVRGVPT